MIKYEVMALSDCVEIQDHSIIGLFDTYVIAGLHNVFSANDRRSILNIPFNYKKT